MGSSIRLKLFFDKKRKRIFPCEKKNDFYFVIYAFFSDNLTPSDDDQSQSGSFREDDDQSQSGSARETIPLETTDSGPSVETISTEPSQAWLLVTTYT